jgi:hypothetical protein
MRKFKVMIGGSMTFSSEMARAKLTLEKMGFEVYVPLDTYYVIDDPSLKYNTGFLEKLGVGRGDAKLVAKTDIFIILNYKKHDIEDYIGPGAYRDLSVAWWLKKKIFLLYPFNESQNNHKLEMEGFKPIILNGNLDNILEHIVLEDTEKDFNENEKRSYWFVYFRYHYECKNKLKEEYGNMKFQFRENSFNIYEIEDLLVSRLKENYPNCHNIGVTIANFIPISKEMYQISVKT